MDEVTLRPAAEADLGYIARVARDPVAREFLMPDAGEPEKLREFWLAGGLYLVELSAGGPVGALGLRVTSERSGICELHRLMIDPVRRGQGLGVAAVRRASRLALVELGLHRLQAETYGDNEAGQRLFEAAGFTREGVRRAAYRRRDGWVDGVLYGLLADEV